LVLVDNRDEIIGWEVYRIPCDGDEFYNSTIEKHREWWLDFVSKSPGQCLYLFSHMCTETFITEYSWASKFYKLNEQYQDTFEQWFSVLTDNKPFNVIHYRIGDHFNNIYIPEEVVAKLPATLEKFASMLSGHFGDKDTISL